MRHLKLHSNLTVLIISKECPQTSETQLDIKFITTDVGFNLLFVYVYNGGSQTAIQDCPLTICYAFGYGVCEGELSGNEGVQVSMCVFGCLCMSVRVYGGAPIYYKEIFVECRHALF